MGKTDCEPLANIPVATTSHLLTPMQMHDSGSVYMPPQTQPLMTPLHTTSTFSRNPVMQSSARTTSMASLARSTSLGNMPWVPTTEGSARLANINPANPFANTMNNFNLHNAPITSGNPAQRAANLVQQSREPQLIPERCVSVGMSRFDFEGNVHGPQGRSAGARQALMIEAAKQQDGFNPKHVSDIIRMTQQEPEVQRASSDPSFFRLTPTRRHCETMHEILGRTFDWKADGPQQQRLEPSLVPSHGSLEAAATTHDPPVSAVKCSQQALDIATRSFCQMPMQHLEEPAGGHHNYGMR